MFVDLNFKFTWPVKKNGKVRQDTTSFIGVTETISGPLPPMPTTTEPKGDDPRSTTLPAHMPDDEISASTTHKQYLAS
jgi:hypothetical protein